jgi:uncharacterized membrane protein
MRHIVHRVSKYDWLLFFHVSGAFLLIGGSVTAAALNISALRRERPSEIAVLLGLTRVAVFAIYGGVLLTLVFGLWLVNASPWGYGYGDAWVIAALVLWVFANAAGGAGGKREEETRKLAERLAGEGDAPSAELNTRMRDPVTLALEYSSGLAVLLILVLMIWKPGA